VVEGSVCPQKNPYTYVYEGDEDCLFLNVYTPQVRKRSLTILSTLPTRNVIGCFGSRA
jgi:carboxylesterase type B